MFFVHAEIDCLYAHKSKTNLTGGYFKKLWKFEKLPIWTKWDNYISICCVLSKM